MVCALPHLIFLLFLLPFSVIAQPSNRNFTAGATLSAAINSSSWLSPSGDFAFGFRQIQDQVTFLLSIWYANIPDQTIVWYANKEKPAPAGSTVEIISDRGLVLKDPAGEELWVSEAIIGRVSYGLMNDTGNFQLISGVSEVLWETFQHPADTLLPTQVMDLGELLSSRRSENNFSTGRFQLHLQEDGNLVLSSINLPSSYSNEPYYASATNNDTNPSNAGKQLIFSESGYLYILKGNGQTFNLSDTPLNPTQDFFYRATLNFDGVFALYKLRKQFTGSENWLNIWSEPENICTTNVAAGSGTCGYNSVCRVNLDKRPTCECPRGYSLLDPNDPYGDCKPDFLLTCGLDEPYNRDLYDIVTVTNTDWPFSDYALLSPFTDDQCKEACMSDCMCAVSVFGEGNKCWKKRIPLSNGKLDRSVSRRTHIKVGKGKFICNTGKTVLI